MRVIFFFFWERGSYWSLISIWVCTIARIWRNADKEHEEKVPKTRCLPNLRVFTYCFALSLYPHVCVLVAPCWKRIVVCNFYVCMRIAVLLQICTTIRFTLGFGPEKWCISRSLFFMMYAPAQNMRAWKYIASRGLGVHSNLALLFWGTITQDIDLHHSFRTVNFDFIVSNQVLLLINYVLGTRPMNTSGTCMSQYMY